MKLPQLLTLFSDDIKILFDCLNGISEFADDTLNNSILSFRDDLKVRPLVIFKYHFGANSKRSTGHHLCMLMKARDSNIGPISAVLNTYFMQINPTILQYSNSCMI